MVWAVALSAIDLITYCLIAVVLRPTVFGV